MAQIPYFQNTTNGMTMKALATILFLLLGLLNTTEDSNSINFNALEGAWEVETVNGEALPHRGVFLMQQPYAFYTEFDVDSKTFVGSRGGSLEIMANKLFFKNEFSTWSPEDVGVSYEITASLKANSVTFEFQVDGQDNVMVLKRIDRGESDLAGSWRITDRMRNGEMTAMRQGARKTIKMITGTRFQWAAFNPETKQFSGTGGGTVTLEDGKYTEHIEFFSRNAERVGANLTFNYSVSGDKWDHSGKSSSGNSIREIWTKQK